MPKTFMRGWILPFAVVTALLTFHVAAAQTTAPPTTAPAAKPATAPPPAAKSVQPPQAQTAITGKGDTGAPKAATAAKAATVDKAPSGCKGLEETPCRVKSAECYWIAATKRKDGTDVKAFCRSKPATTAKATDKATAKATTTAPVKPAEKAAATPTVKAAPPASGPAPKSTAEKTK